MSRAKRGHLDEGFTFAGRGAKVVDIDPETKELLILKHGQQQALAVAWDVDPSGYGFWRIQQVGVENGTLVTKELKKGDEGAAFYGEVSVVGAGGNDLFTSDGYEDLDVVDTEGNVLNKVKEIRVFPKRYT
jgi:hypothetical protein